MKLFEDDKFYWALGAITLILGVVLLFHLSATNPVRLMYWLSWQALIYGIFLLPLLIIIFILSHRKNKSTLKSITNALLGGIGIIIALRLSGPIIPFLGIVFVQLTPVYWLIVIILIGQAIFRGFTRSVANEVVRQQNAQNQPQDNSLEWLDDL